MNSHASPHDSAPVARLPHRPPFLLLDRVIAIEPGSWAAAVKRVTHADPLVGPDGVWPSVLLAEVMAQTAGLAAARAHETAGMMAAIDRFRCRGVIAAGDDLVAFALVRRRFGASALVHAAVRAAGHRRAAAEIILRLG